VAQGQGRPWPGGGEVRAGLCYIYGAETNLEPQHAPQTLHFAHVYGVHSFAAAVARSFREHLTPALALKTVVECEVLGHEQLQLLEECEQHIAKHFEECVKDNAFVQLLATHLAQLVRNPDLEVSREEVVLEAVLAWHKAAPNRDSLVDVLLLDIDFRPLSLRALHSVDRRAAVLQARGQAALPQRRDFPG
jgi:hypothetical protein